jgi:hypothetical protein
MDLLSIEATGQTPAVRLDPTEGVLEFKGRSLPDNTVAFYAPILDWLEGYRTDPGKRALEVIMAFDYFNTASAGCLLDVFKALERIQEGHTPVRIRWEYEEDDEDMLELGEEYEMLVKLPFDFVELSG